MQKLGIPNLMWEKSLSVGYGKSSTINQNRNSKESHKPQALSTHLQAFHNTKWLPVRAQRHQQMIASRKSFMNILGIL